MTAVALQTRQPIVAAPAHGGDMLTDTSQFELAQRWANALSQSQLVPKHLQGKPADCLIGLMMAKQLGDNPLTVLQSIYVVSGKAGWSANYMIARANQSGVFKGRITWETTGAGKDMTVKAKAVLADTQETVSATVSMQMAMAEGWTANKKYQTMPEHMLRFRSATMLVRLYCPEVMLGMATADELETDETPQIAPPRTVAASLDAFADEPHEAAAPSEDLPEAIDAPAPEVEEISQVPATDWSAYVAAVKADFAKHKTLKALTADRDDVRERLANEDAPEGVLQEITTAFLEASRELAR